MPADYAALIRLEKFSRLTTNWDKMLSRQSVKLVRMKALMTNDAISEAIRLYREAGMLFQENKRIAKEAVKRFRSQTTESQENAAWVEQAASNASEMRTLLERIISLGEEHEAVRQHKVYALAHRNLGLYSSRRFKSFREAFPTYLKDVTEHLNKAISLGVNRDRKVTRTLGAAYYQSGKFREAVEPLKASIEANPNDEVARYHLCLTYLGLREREKAREQFEALKENSSGINYHLAKILEPMIERQEKRVDEAEQEELKRFIEGFCRIEE